jgi:hypothetical protein
MPGIDEALRAVVAAWRASSRAFWAETASHSPMSDRDRDAREEGEQLEEDALVRFGSRDGVRGHCSSISSGFSDERRNK